MEDHQIGSYPHRIIFLDIDGVLNGEDEIDISQTKARRLRNIIQQFNVDIVLSSMWRLSRERRRMVKASFLEAGLPRPISYTPCVANGHERGTEILLWLFFNSANLLPEYNSLMDDVLFEYTEEFGENQFFLPVPIEVAQFVILDDLDLRDKKYGFYTPFITNHFVRTPRQFGLTEHNEHQLRTFFGSNDMGLDTLLPSSLCEACGKEETGFVAESLNKYFCSPGCHLDFCRRHGLE